MAASSCCASRTPTARAPPSRRSTAILDGLTWLGLEWDGDVTYQFERAARHAEVAAQMLPRQGLPLLCIAAGARRDARRAEGAGQVPMRYDGRWRDRDPRRRRQASRRWSG